jgi:Bacteriophage head to tail connecting protein
LEAKLPKVSAVYLTNKKNTLAMLRDIRLPWWNLWRDLANYYLPRRYTWLLSAQERGKAVPRNDFILDSTGTKAARTLAAGMMNGITSPSRPWFKLRLIGFADEENSVARVWLDEVERRLMLVMAESNFYNALAVMYLDLVVFGTSAVIVYEDFDSVIRCYNCALGEYYLSQSHRQEVDTFAREFSYNVNQIVARWGKENCSTSVKDAYQRGAAALHNPYVICHLIEPNIKDECYLPGNYKFREVYYEQASSEEKVLGIKGFNEFPVLAPRWELQGNDSYGTSPALDALGDVIQLQHETKAKAKGLDKMNDPPIIADIQLQNRPTALLPRGITYIAGINNVGAKPIYTVQPPIAEISNDLREISARIRTTFHNELFNGVSQLDTVRSAREIESIEGERLILLTAVLERFQNESLDPAINRIFAIANRAGILPPPPQELQEAEIEIQYVSLLAAAQSAVSTQPLERWLQFVGSVAAIYPKAVNIPNFDDLIRNYGTRQTCRVERASCAGQGAC